MRNTPSIAAAMPALFVISFLATQANAQLSVDKSYPVAGQPGEIRIRDFTRDGAPDAIIGTVTGVTYLPGRTSATGRFDAGPISGGANFADHMVVGDMNLDGVLDAVSSGLFPNVVVRLGLSPNANFWQAPISYTTGGVVNGVALADLNHDGNLDVLTICNPQSMLYRLFGSPTGTLGAATGFSVGAGQSPVALDVDDINRDGLFDVATANMFNVSYLAGTVGGGFAGVTSAGGPAGTSSMYISDMNEDGFPDAVCANSSLALIGLFTGSTTGLNFYNVVGSGQYTLNAMFCDINLDGHQDIVASIYPGNAVEWFAGNGAGAFSPATVHNSTGDYLFGMDAGDVNLDGRSDIVVSEMGTSTMTVFPGVFNKASGIDYPNPTAYALPPWNPAATPRTLALADFQPDGDTDVMIGLSDARYSYYQNFGAGALTPFATFVNLPIANQTISADFNNDGRPDLAHAATVASLLLNHNFSWGHTAFNTNFGAQASTSLAAADFNLDGLLDVAVNDGGLGRTYICTGTGVAPFAVGPFITLPAVCHRIATTDFNLDGRPDFVTASSSTGNAYVVFNNGSLTFSGPTAFPVGSPVIGIQAGDLSNDGKPDFMVLNAAAGQYINCYRGNGTGQFYGLVSSFVNGNNPVREAMGDFNVDGELDAMVVRACGAHVLMYGNTEGSYYWGGFMLGSCNNVDAAAADLNHDGLCDLVTVSTTLNQPVYVQLASRTSGPDQFSAGSCVPAETRLMAVNAADVNHDGRPDIVTTDNYSNFARTIRINNGSSFDVDSVFPVSPFPRPGTIADMNLDGLNDFISPSQTFNVVSIQLAIGFGNYLPAIDYPTGISPLWAAAGDINQDGFPDVVTADFSGNTVSRLYNNIGGGLLAPLPLPAGIQPCVVILNDFDSDGLLDIIGGLYGSNNFQYYKSLGSGSFNAPVNYVLLTGSACTGLDAGDLDQNGTLDLFTANFFSNSATGFLNPGNANFNFGFGANIPFRPITVAITDLDGNGLNDVAIGNNQTNQIYFMYGQGGINFTLSPAHMGPREIRNFAIADFNLDGRSDIAVSAYVASCVGIFMNNAPTSPFINNYGTGTAGCTGRLAMNTNKTPSINTPDFAFNCTGMPRNSLGLGLVTDTQDIPGNDFFSLLVLMHLDFVNMTEFYYFNIYSDNWGVGTGPIPIPNDNNLIGMNYYAQTLAFGTIANGEDCSVSLYKFVTSLGLHLIVQP